MLHFKPREEDRQRVSIRARLRGAGPEREVCILNVSSRGIRAMAADPPSRGDFVELVVGNHSLVGQVKWSSARRFGMVLREPISVFALLTGENGAITLRQRNAATEQRRARSDDRSGFVHKLLLGVFVTAAIAAALYFADIAGEGLAPLQDVRSALAGARPA